MKKFNMLILILMVSFTLNAQDLRTSEVPKNLTEILIQEYPNAKDIEWERKGNDYKVEFEVGKMDHEIWFDKDGKKVREEKEITIEELPLAISTLLKNQYADYKIDSVDSIEKNGKTTYRVELEISWDDEITITFTASGKVLNINKD